MHTRNSEPCGAIDQQAFESAIRDNLSPGGVVAIIAYLQSASIRQPCSDEQHKALLEVQWFANTLTEMIGVKECNRLMNELHL